MSIVAVVGLQWGDEGKGKITDVLASGSDLVVRFQGGANAGHTLVVGDKIIRSHLIPSGILYPKTISVIGPGCVFDPEIFEKELNALKDLKVKTGKILISNRAHVVFPYHKYFDGIKEEYLGKNAIGTTKMGIGPCYSDKVNRIGITIGDIVSGTDLKPLLQNSLDEKNFMIKSRYNKKQINIKDMLNWIDKYRELIRKFTGNAYELVNDYASRGKKILFEGAQGTFLDLDWGTYPFVTSSNTVAGNIYIGGGLSPKYKVNVLGIVKAYSTRVGNGPFPGELNDEISELIRDKGKEFGATTGRPRRCGWINLDLLKFAVLMNGVTSIALTKLDVLSCLDKIGVITEPKKGINKKVPNTFLETNDMQIEYLNGWDISIDNIRTFKDLPKNSREYIKYIEKVLGVPASIISLGAQRKKYIMRKEIW